MEKKKELGIQTNDDMDLRRTNVWKMTVYSSCYCVCYFRSVRTTKTQHVMQL